MPSRTHGARFAHPFDKSTTALPPMVTPHPQFFLPQMHGSGMVPNFPTMPSMYYPTQGFMNGRLHNRELHGHGHNALTPASDPLGPSDFRPLLQVATLVESLVNPRPRVIPQNSMGDSTPTAGSSTGEVRTPESEAEPPTQALVRGSEFPYHNHLESYDDDNGWEVIPAFNPDFNPSPMMGFR